MILRAQQNTRSFLRLKLFPSTKQPRISLRSFASANDARNDIGSQAWTTTDPNVYCRDIVQQKDFESHLIAQMWPTELQAGFYAIRAFSVELATVQDNVSSPMIGQMRMQFWRDAIKGISDGRPPRHPIAIALYQVLQSGVHLPMYHFKRIIDARDAELHTPTHLTTGIKDCKFILKAQNRTRCVVD